MSLLDEQQSLERNKMSIAWSLNSLVVCMRFCGIPTFYEKSGFMQHIFGYFWRFLSLICLFINCFYNIYDFLKDLKVLFVCERRASDRMSDDEAWLLLPTTVHNLFRSFSTPGFLLGVPLVFTLQFYLTGRLGKIWILIREIAERVLIRPNDFYRNCRRLCLFLIVISFVVIYSLYLMMIDFSIRDTNDLYLMHFGRNWQFIYI